MPLAITSQSTAVLLHLNSFSFFILGLPEVEEDSAAMPLAIPSQPTAVLLHLNLFFHPPGSSSVIARRPKALNPSKQCTPLGSPSMHSAAHTYTHTHTHTLSLSLGSPGIQALLANVSLFTTESLLPLANVSLLTTESLLPPNHKSFLDNSTSSPQQSAHQPTCLILPSSDLAAHASFADPCRLFLLFAHRSSSLASPPNSGLSVSRSRIHRTLHSLTGKHSTNITIRSHTAEVFIHAVWSECPFWA
ncbi:hypothetical protein J3F84DRAFT_389020 [Trichoderma pleuroticola]